MIPRIMEVQNPGSYLSVSRGHLLVTRDQEKVGSVPLDDIAILLISNQACSLTISVLNSLLERGAQVIFCGENFKPSGILLPVSNMLVYSSRLELQISISESFKERIWKQVVKHKVQNQIDLLKSIGENTERLDILIDKIQPGDTTNIEAQVARIYWQLLLGEDFRRNKAEEGINSLLNYGYTVLRAATSRAIVSSGLNSALSLHHSNKENPTALVDDLMEPFRPVVDLIVYRLTNFGMNYICSESKAELASMLVMDLITNDGVSNLPQILQRYCYSYIECLESKKVNLEFFSLKNTYREILKDNFEDA